MSECGSCLQSVLSRTGLGIALRIVLFFSGLVRLKARCCCSAFLWFVCPPLLSPVERLVRCEKKTDSLRTLLCFLLWVLLECAFVATAKESVCESAAGFFGNSIDCNAFVYCNKSYIGGASSWFQCLIDSDFFLFLLLFVKSLGFFVSVNDRVMIESLKLLE